MKKKFILELDIDNARLRFRSKLEEAIRKELSKKKHSWNFKEISLYEMPRSQELLVDFTNSLEKYVKQTLDDHRIYDHDCNWT